jgi:4-aminobutyrate aminotransferase-like enzyme
VENSHRVGAELCAGLVALREQHPHLLGEIRGSGLYVGVDTPDAAPIVNGLRARRVLISATGRTGNTLKIRPPLVFSSDDVAVFLEALEAVLAQPND